MRIDSWINQPIAFWSSLIYLVPVLLLNRQYKERNDIYRLWNISFWVLTLSSMFCHASFIRLSVAMDFAGIGMIMGFFSFIHFTNLKSAPKSKLYGSYVFFFLVMVSMFFYMHKWSKIAVCILIFMFAFYEVILKMGKDFWKAKSLQLSVLILTVSFLLFLMDDQRIAMCDPHGWIHGHTLWHFGTAWSAYYYGKWRFIDGKI